ncbi:DUF732 domain-containing protein [Mycobacterium sp. SVM_VP21]|nr:DUF732 domain-containing protein [Mycobacterium sp. SVM_VP21]
MRNRSTRITGQHRKPSTLREKIIPATVFAAALLIFSYALSGLIARADTDAGIEYGHQNAATICAGLDADPTVAGVREALGNTVRGSALSHYQAALAVGTAVHHHCNWHEPLLQQYVAAKQQGHRE